MRIFARVGIVALHLFGELVAPMRCAACDVLVAPRHLFCAACAPSVMRAGPQAPSEDAVFDYGGAVATAIARFKYAGRSDLADRFAEVMAGAAARESHGTIELVVPVPLHPSRLVERGFDQAALLGTAVARRWAIPCAPRALAPPTSPTHSGATLRRRCAGGASSSSTTCAPPARRSPPAPMRSDAPALVRSVPSCSPAAIVRDLSRKALCTRIERTARSRAIIGVRFDEQ
jgi:hypothetical protein